MQWLPQEADCDWMENERSAQIWIRVSKEEIQEEWRGPKKKEERTAPCEFYMTTNTVKIVCLELECNNCF